MKIIKDKQIIEDTISHLTDDQELINGNITVSATRWSQDKAKLKNHQGNTGIRLAPSDTLEDITEDLAEIDMVALEFPAFTDGRSFSHARLLRSRYGYTGEIRAIGNYMPDQVFYLTRVGVNAFEFESTDELNTALSTMNDFTVQYQTSSN